MAARLRRHACGREHGHAAAVLGRGGKACATAVECSGAGMDGVARLRRHDATNADAVARRLGEEATLGISVRLASVRAAD
jgi:hypothetical protein